MKGTHVVIGGGSGFIGSALTRELRGRGAFVTWISRREGRGRMTWADLERDGLPACDAVVSLAGQPILDMRRRWSAAHREEVIQSRVETTTRLVGAINASPTPPEVFVSTAGQCFHGTGASGASDPCPELDEDSTPMGIDFPAELAGRWEAAADGVDTSRVRHAGIRLGVVLGDVRRASVIGRLWRVGRTRGFLPLMRLPFCLGLGAQIGSGPQPLPWVHIDDVVGIILHLLGDRTLTGRFNAVAPGIVSNGVFIRTFARHLRRPILWTVPDRWVRAVVGAERASILLDGQTVRPRRTLASGYAFRFTDLDAALTDLVEVAV